MRQGKCEFCCLYFGSIKTIYESINDFYRPKYRQQNLHSIWCSFYTLWNIRIIVHFPFLFTLYFKYVVSPNNIYPFRFYRSDYYGNCVQKLTFIPSTLPIDPVIFDSSLYWLEQDQSSPIVQLKKYSLTDMTLSILNSSTEYMRMGFISNRKIG